MVHDERRNNCFCITCDIPASKGYYVRFGREICKRFSNSYPAAAQFLNGLRFKTFEGTYDRRDYRKDYPLGFITQAEKYLKLKRQDVKRGTYRNIRNFIHKAAAAWGTTNVKSIGYGQIEDYLFDLNVSDKTRSNARSVLSGFFKWLNRREGIPIPDMPEIKFELGWRNIIDIETQHAIIDEVYKISHGFNPRIWIGIKWLSTYIALRPNELRNIKERHIDVSGFIVIPSPKEKNPKLVAMLQEDIDLYHSLKPRGLPDLYFFRHIKGNGSAKPGTQFGKDYLYKWWKKACKNLGIEGVDLYGGTRHSTATALGEYFSEQEIMDAGSMHKSNKAAQRYIQAKKNDSINIYAKVREMQGEAKILDIKKARK